MAAYDGFDDVQSQAPAVPVLGPGFVQLVEPVDYQGQLLGRDGLAFVGYGDVGLAAAFPDGEPQGLALGTEFYRVVDEIVDHLGHIVPVGDGVYRMLRHIDIHIQLLVVDLLFKGDQHTA